MKKTYQMFLALVALMLLGATNVSAEEISLQEVPFWQHGKTGEPWGLDAPKTTQITAGEEGCAWVIGTPTGQPYGDSNVCSFADLSGFDKLVVTYSAGTPRILMHRDQDEGAWNATESSSHLIEYPACASAWAGKYFTDKDGVLTVDLKQLVNDKGYAYLHAIKGANWQDVTVESIVVIRKGKEKQVGWINLINNSNMEGEDNSSFFSKEAPSTEVLNSVISEGVVKVKAIAKVANPWDSQFWFRFNETVPAGTKYRVSFDYRSDAAATVSTQAHAEPSDYIHYEMFGDLNFTPEWQTFTKEAEVTASQAGPNDGGGLFQSVAFNLSGDADNNFYFDNVKFEVYKFGTSAEYAEDAIQIDFGFETNIPALCKAAGKSRVLFPNENAKVLVNGEEVGITTIEGFADGRFYIFLDEPVEENSEIEVIYTNAEGDLQLKYAGGPNVGEAIPNVDEMADFNLDVVNAYDDVYPYTMLPPSIVAAKPEQGSFNIKNDLKEFYVKFDKPADAAKIVATLDGQALTISPNTGLVEEITMTYGGADMANGLHSIHITKVYPEQMIIESICTDTTYTFSVGPTDPSDVPLELIPISYFNSCANGGVPEGFKLYADNMEERTPANTYSGGARLFNDFAAGGDFTSALYMRTNYLTYGFNDDEHKLTLEAGRTYTLSFNTARWKSSGEYLKVVILNAEGAEQFAQTVTCNPDVNGSKNAVKNSSAYTITFTPEATGDYELRFVVANNADGEDAGETWHELLLANVKFGYIPNTYGVVEMMAVEEALEKAKKIQETYAGERYDGEAQSALNSTIARVEADKDNYTAPSECYGAVEDLGNCSNALTEHANLCNDYDKLIKDGSDVVRQNEHPNGSDVPTKFVKLDLFAQLKAVVDKYHGVSEMVNEGTEEEPNWQKHYTFDELKDDAQLTGAVAELGDIVNTTSKLFTTGASQRNTTGVAALVERLRLGAEALKVLDAEDPAIQIALDALDDDDTIAEALMNKNKINIYGKLKDGVDIFHETIVDPDTQESSESDKSYDMTVFVKNPNMYAREFSTEVPGWTTIAGNPTAWSSWDGNVSHNNKTPYVEDCCIYLQWHAACNVEQTITNLPAGVYTVYFNSNDNSGESTGTYVYVKKSDTPAVEEGAELDPTVNYAGYAQVDNSGWDRSIEGIEVTDGQLTLGFVSGTVSQPFLEYVRITMTGKAEGFDYAKAYDEAITSIDETVTVNTKVNNGVMYNLSGQKVNKSYKGIVIMNGKKFVVK